MRKQVALVIGAFNPVTKAHVGMGRALKRALPDAEIVYVPCNGAFLRGWKKLDGDDILPDADRLRLLRGAVEPEGFTVSMLEADGTLDGKTVHTAAWFRERGCEVFISLGMDKPEELHRWYRAEELVRDNRFLIFARDGQRLEDHMTDFILSFRARFTELPMDETLQTYSSTQIRKAWQEGHPETVRHMCPDNVYQYLEAHPMNKEFDFDAARVAEELTAWLRQWFDKNGKGCKAVLGISGGKDSSVTAAVCAGALGKENVVGVLMPDHEQADIRDSLDLCEHLGIPHHIINIGPVTDAMKAQVAAGAGMTELCPQAKTNLPPRIRMATLYAVSQNVGGRVINTCNLSEDWVGYSTKYGDAAGDVSPLANLTVTEVKALGRYLGLPAHLVDKAPSDGLCGKTDEDNLGFTYAVLDRYIREGVCEDEETRKLIDRKHAGNLFKLRPMESFPYGNRMGYYD